MTTDGITIDPAVSFSLRAALALLFLWAGVHKLRDVAAFRGALEGYRIVPRATVRRMAVAVIGTELVLAVTLIATASPLPAIAAAALQVLYSAVIAVNLRRGRRYIDCGCAGPAGRQPISPGLILRNVLIVGVALTAALPATARGLLWIDSITITAGVIVLAVLYATLDTLIATTSSIQALAPPRPQALATRLRGGANA